jgi:toxin-antitoxin system PIN domain toxin
MIAVDTNVLVYAHRRETAENGRAADTLRALAEGHQRWAIPWPCIYEFFSVVTNVRIWKDVASSPSQAWQQIDAWSRAPSLTLLTETVDFLTVLERLVRRARVRGPVVHDARIAALCLAHGVEALFTRDRDFALFPELRIEDPFAG